MGPDLGQVDCLELRVRKCLLLASLLPLFSLLEMISLLQRDLAISINPPVHATMWPFGSKRQKYERDTGVEMQGNHLVVGQPAVEKLSVLV